MRLITIEQKYTDYLREFDYRVSKNLDDSYVRPYLGALLNVDNKKYFAPLTSSNKGKKLREFPKEENTTFYPIKNCKYGGINLNNMIPVIDGVYHDYLLDKEPSIDRHRFLEKMIRILRANENYIVKKARKLYNMKMTGNLYSNYDAITCDFKKLEEAVNNYNIDETDKNKTEDTTQLPSVEETIKIEVEE